MTAAAMQMAEKKVWAHQSSCDSGPVLEFCEQVLDLVTLTEKIQDLPAPMAFRQAPSASSCFLALGFGRKIHQE